MLFKLCRAALLSISISRWGGASCGTFSEEPWGRGFGSKRKSYGAFRNFSSSLRWFQLRFKIFDGEASRNTAPFPTLLFITQKPTEFKTWYLRRILGVNWSILFWSQKSRCGGSVTHRICWDFGWLRVENTKLADWTSTLCQRLHLKNWNYVLPPQIGPSHCGKCRLQTNFNTVCEAWTWGHWPILV